MQTQTTGVKGYPLSLQQARLWALQGESQAYHAKCAVWLKGELDMSAFLYAFQSLVRRHEILRTTFHRFPGIEIPLQVVTSNAEIHCPVIDLQDLSAENQMVYLYDELTSLQWKIANREADSPLSIVLLRLSSEIHLLLIHLPALCADGYTLMQMVAELSHIYDCILRRMDQDEEPVQYADVAAWQEQLLASEEAEVLRQYWREIDWSQLATCRLPFEPKVSAKDFSVDGGQKATFAPCVFEVPLEETLASQIRHLAQRYCVSVDAWFLACWEVTLWRLIGKQDLLIGVTCDGRVYEELTEELTKGLGLYTRLVPVSVRPGDDLPFDQMVTSVNKSLLETIEQQCYFSWELPSVGAAACPCPAGGYQGRDEPLPLRMPFFSICFESERWPASFIAGKLSLSLCQRFCCIEPFALKLSVLQLEDSLQLEVHYDPQRISTALVHRLVTVFLTLLEGTIAQPQAKVCTLPLLKPDEQISILTPGRAPTRPIPPRGLHQLFEEQAELRPNHLAVICSGGVYPHLQEQLTYQQLNEQANQLAHVLRQRGVGPNRLAPTTTPVVALCLPRNSRMIVGLLGILKAGGAYLPLDPEIPSVRLIYQLQESQAVLFLTQRGLVKQLPEWEERTLYLEELEQEPVCAGNMSLPCEPEDLAYVIYTSGSTGVPKGVMIRQRSVVHYTRAICELLGAEAGWHYATVSTLAADLGNTAIFCALASGGCVQVLDYATITSVEKMTRWVEQHPIDVLKIVPSHLSALLTGEMAQELLPRQALVLGGETCSLNLIAQLQQLGATCQIYNHYGPTETTIGVLVHQLTKLLQYPLTDRSNEENLTPLADSIDVSDSSRTITNKSSGFALGKPIANTEIYILDDQMYPVPLGVTGELYIGGAGLALGYLSQPDQTAEHFVPHPYITNTNPLRRNTDRGCRDSGLPLSLQPLSAPGARLYRTGDLARYNENGEIEFVGRCDHQVKLRGYRIELAEIETALRQCQGVWDCVVLLQEEGPGAPQLIGYVVARTASGLTSLSLREMLEKAIPEFMVPASFVMLEALPLTPNGKVDRQRLPKPEPSLDSESQARGEPRSPLEEALVGIWKELLALPMLGIHDNFFTLGGHSLLVTRLIARVRAVLQVDLPLQAVFNAPTVAGLAQLVEQALRKGEGIQMPPLVPVARPEEIPLSFAQQRLWFLEQLEPESTAYLIARIHHFSGVLNTKALEKSFVQLVQRQEILRTTFAERDGHPVQVIHPIGTWSYSVFPVIDLRELRPEQRERETQQLSQQEALCPCDLVKGPLLRVSLLRLNLEEHHLLLTKHHIITDAWSNAILVRELTALYWANVYEHPFPLVPLPIQYADYALWQREWLQGQVLDAQLAYWRKQLAHVSPLELPTDHPRPTMQTYQGAIQMLQLPTALSERLVQHCKQANVTLFMFLLAAFQVLLARWSGGGDIAVGTPIANRNCAEIEGLIGFFVNTLVLRTNLGGNPTFEEMLQQVRKVCLGAYAHQDLPFEKVVDALQPERDLSRSPLFQVMFVLQNAPVGAEQTNISVGVGQASLEVNLLAAESTTSKFDLTLSVVETGLGLHCQMEYATDLFDAETITRLLSNFQTLLAGIVQDPQAHISDLPLLMQAEREQLLVEWNATGTNRTGASPIRPQDRCVHQLFEEQVERTPDATALIFEDKTLTYAELNSQANMLAHRLLGAEVGPDVLVGVCMERSLELVVALLSVLKAGGAYVPLDPHAPQERLTFLLEDAQMPLVIIQPHLCDQISPTRIKKICLDAGLSASHLEDTDNPHQSVQPDNLAYMIYTSGSTGKPKGAMNTHRGICNTLLWAQETYQLTQSDCLLQRTPLSFDPSLQEILWPLITGARLVISRPERYQDISYLLSLMRQEAVTVLDNVPSVLQMVIEEPNWSYCRTVRLVICGGEPLSFELQKRFQVGHNASLQNLYGPTEASINATFWPCKLEDGDHRVPIGRPIANTQIYLLDESQQPVPIGVTGEVHIGGVGLARGYWRRPELTAERFIPNPFVGTGLVPIRPGSRLYRTGDLARYRVDGALEFLGRRDNQVKVRGYRIELGEIETVLGEHEAIQECVVLAREDEAGEKRLAPTVSQLVAYPVVRAGQTITPNDLRSYLQDRLPSYMIPAIFVPLDALPLTPSGKVDWRALPAPPGTRPELAEIFVAPHTSVERTLAMIWSEVLRVKRVGIHDNFFTLGGDSILSIQVVSRARQAGLHLTPRQIFQYQTIEQLSCVVQTETNVLAEQRLVLGSLPLTPIQHWFFDLHLLAPHHWNQTLFLQVAPMVEAHPVANRAFWQEMVHAWLKQHDVLRLRFTVVDGQWRQELCTPDPNALPFVVIDLSQLSEAKQNRTVTQLATQTQASLDLMKGPILRLVLFDRGRTAPLANLLLIVIHHLAVDGVSWRILLEDMQIAWEQAMQGHPITLPAKTSSYKTWAEHLVQYAQSSALQQELNYWLTRTTTPVSPLPQDLPADKAAQTEISTQVVSVRMTSEETSALLKVVPAIYHTQINELLLTALALTLTQWIGTSSILVDLEGHGREDLFEDVDVSRTIGWFTSLFPMHLDLAETTTVIEALKEVKEQLRTIPHHGIGYGLLRYLSPDPTVREQLRAQPAAEISFNYLGQFDQARSHPVIVGLSPLSAGPTHHPQARRAYLLDVTCQISNNQLGIAFGYSQRAYRRSTIEQLADRFTQVLRRLVAEAQARNASALTPSDFPLAPLKQSLLDQILQQVEDVGLIEDIYPLSPMQEGLLFHALYAPESSIYLTQMQWQIEGSFQIQALQQAFQQVIKRHTVLRTRFLWDGVPQPLQIIQRQVPLPWTSYDWQDLGEQEQQTRLTTLLQEDRERGFDPRHAPLVRITLVQLREQVFFLVLSSHHLLLDGWSQPLLLAEVRACYQATCQGKEPLLAPVHPYRDYIAWLQKPDGQAEQFWRTYLAGFTTPNRVLGHSGVSSTTKYQTATQQLQCSATLTTSLQERAQQLQLTLNTLIQGAWALLLSCYCGQNDVVFGSTTSGRSPELPGMETMIGLFINTLPVRVQVRPEAPLSEWLRQLQAEQIEARQYETTPLVQIQACSAAQSLFESLMVFQNYPVADSILEQSGDVEIQQLSTVEQTHYPLMLKIIPLKASLTLLLQYDEARFEAATISRMLKQLQVLLQAIADQPEQRLGTLSLLSEEERYQQLRAWNATEAPYPENTGIHQLFEQQVERTPERIAAVFGDIGYGFTPHLTYRELDLRANQLAHYLQGLGVGPEVLVGVCMENTLEVAISVLGILKAGGVVVPLDPELPQERLKFLLVDTHLSVLLIQHRLREYLPENLAKKVWIERDWEVIAQESTTKPESEINAEHLMYVIYTSGSTGTPKGVSLPHRALVNLLTWHRSNLREQSRALQFAPLSFDASFHEMFAAWCGGGTLYIVAASMRRDVMRLASFLSDMAIEKVILPVVMLQQLAGEYSHEKHWPASLKEVTATGEQLRINQPLIEMFETLDNCTLHNHYGPSESHVVTAYTLSKPSQTWPTHPPIGRPIMNTQIYVLDRNMQPVPVGMVGELYIGGMNLARGYLDRPALTAERFLPNPFVGDVGVGLAPTSCACPRGGERLYKTGDLARYRVDGIIEYLGRSDHQIKIRGYRIELGEIEALLNQHAGVREGVVLAHEDTTGEKQLVAYIVLDQQRLATSTDLHGYLRAKLPDYMVPSSFVVLDALPLTPTGKVDRRVLPRPDFARPELAVAFVAPRTPAEEVIAEIWAEVLGVEQIGVYDNFFELGGHSLRAVQVISGLRVAFQMELPLPSLFEKPTIDELIGEMARLRGGREIVEEIALVLKELEQLSEDDVQNILYN